MCTEKNFPVGTRPPENKSKIIAAGTSRRIFIGDIMKYTTLLFDSDDTLLDFKAAEKHALSATFETFAPGMGDTMNVKYHEINRALWASYEKGEIPREDIFRLRFVKTFEHFGIPVPNISIPDFFQTQLSSVHKTMPDVPEVLEKLSAKYKLHVITNSVKTTQMKRLTESGLAKYFGHIFISEELGTQKPAAEFFDIVFNTLKISRSDALIIGDSYSSDITGGINAGVDTCWFNFKNDPCRKDAPTYEIKKFTDLLEILL